MGWAFGVRSVRRPAVEFVVDGRRCNHRCGERLLREELCASQARIRGITNRRKASQLFQSTEVGGDVVRVIQFLYLGHILDD